MLTAWCAWCVLTVYAAAAPPGYRELADGVLTVIPPNVAVAEMLLQDNLYDVTIGRRGLDWKPKQAPAGKTFFALSTGLEFPRELWCLEFAFKPPRSILVEIPISASQMRRSRVWYLVYRVRNVAGPSASWMKLKTETDDPATDRSKRAVERFERPIRFRPHFVLESFEVLGEGEGPYLAYLDRVMPTALAAIRRREDPRRPLLDSAEMAAEEIAPGEERWGVATWESIDPRIDFFSITVTGLTNALRWRLPPGADIKADNPPNAALQQVLQSLRLDFWKPGDADLDRDEQASIGFRGMVERMALGARLLDDSSRPALNASTPEVGLERLGLGWGKQGIDKAMLEPDLGDDPETPDWGSLRPLQTVIRKVLALPDAAARATAVREVFGERGVRYLRELAEAVVMPVDPEREAVRREALESAGISAEDAAKAPLAAVVKLIDPFESLSPSDRREAAGRLFGEAGQHLEWLMREVQAARALATLEKIGLPLREVQRADALAAFESLETALMDEKEPDRIVVPGEGLSLGQPPYDIEMSFVDAGGTSDIKEGTPVKKNGTLLGRVSRVEQDGTLVIAKIESYVPVYRDEQPRISTTPQGVEIQLIPNRQTEILRALFGPKGPKLYRDASAVHEGIDHGWAFRYDL